MKMAKAKTATAIPAGFEVKAAEGVFGVVHDFHKEQICTGKVTAIKTVDTADGKKRVMTVKTADGERQVWESFQLSGVFDTKKIIGKSVWFRYDGQKKFVIKKGKNKGKTAKMNQFTAAIK
jgi:hypothetical protein